MNLLQKFSFGMALVTYSFGLILNAYSETPKMPFIIKEPSQLVFTSEDELKFVLLFNGRVHVPVQDHMSMNIYDFFGNLTMRVAPDKAKKSNEIRFNLSRSLMPMHGWYRAVIKAYYNGEEWTGINQSDTGHSDYFTFAVLPRHNDIFFNSAFGICEHYLNEKNASLLKDAGIKWVRIDVFWEGIQKDELGADWERLDKIIEIARKYDLHILLIIDYTAQWASTAPLIVKGYDRTRYAPKAYPYLRFLEELVSRYKDDVKYWEIWNEPNIGFWKSSEEEYADLLKISYDAIKQQDPEAVVLMGGLSGAPPSWTETLNREGVIDKFDRYNIHPYHYHSKPETKLENDLDKFIVAANKIDKKPVWITEMGAPTNIVSLEEQASYLVRSMVISLSKGIEKIFWYELADRDKNPDDNESNFGILYSDLSPKPAYVAYAILIRQLDGADFVQRLDLGSKSAYGYRFVKPNQRIDVLWTVKDNEKVVLKNFPEKVTVTDIMGVEREMTTNHGNLELNLTQYPVYVHL